MAKSTANADKLRSLSSVFKNQAEEIKKVESSLDLKFRDLGWDDPVGQDFLIKFDDLKRKIDDTLVPALQEYSIYLDNQAQHIYDFNSNLL